ncbi:MAG: phosphatase PAP2 family protein [Micromonosporaceae bacterium]|nr:phosphatase PAP2 family protein [Micromonosporaceae bacterium]
MPDRRAGRWPQLRSLPGGWWLDTVLLAGFVVLTLALIGRAPPLLGLDVAVADWCDAHRPSGAEAVALVLNFAGQGSPLALLALGAAAVRSRRFHSIRPVVLVVATYTVLNGSVGALKVFFDRAAPHRDTLAHPERLFELASGMSYPSGHVANAIVWYTVLAIVLGEIMPRRLWLVLRWAPAALVVGTTTYLSFHWVTDGIAAVLVGALIARVLLRIPWDTVPMGSWLSGRGLDGPAALGVPGTDPTGSGAKRRAGTAG